MKKSIFIICFVLSVMGSLKGFSQTDGRKVVGVAKFTSEVDSPFCASVAEKVVQVVTNTKRFIVVDRTSYDKVVEELELQKSEAFIDSKNTAAQGMAVAAEYIIIGHLIKMNIYTMKNPDGSVNGYKASAAFTLKVNDVETGITTEAEGFQTSVSPMAASKEQAVNQALQSVEEPLYEYFKKTFPVNVNIVKILETKKDAVTTLLVDGGKAVGLSQSNIIEVEIIEMLGGKPYPSVIGELKVTKLSGEDFAECKVVKGGKDILSHFNAKDNINCKLVVK